MLMFFWVVTGFGFPGYCQRGTGSSKRRAAKYSL
jgi:hypothetical protein